MRRWFGRLAGAIALLLLSPLVAPQVLAFPHRYEVAGSTVWSDVPHDETALRGVLARSRALLAASPIATGEERRRIFLTDGGWRWAYLSLGASGSFALTRPLTDPVIIVNRTSAAMDLVWNGRAIAGERSLSGVIAHETMHGVLRERYGRIAMLARPQWLVEGYCDHVAGESSMDAAEAAELEASGASHPALPYYQGRLRVEALLDANGGSVDALFAEEQVR